MELTFVFFNRGMFAATGESDKPTFNLKLTDDQVAELKKVMGDSFDILSIHEVIKPK